MDINVKRKKKLPVVIVLIVTVIMIFILILNGLLLSSHRQNRENRAVLKQLLAEEVIPDDSNIHVFFWKEKYYIITSDSAKKIYAYDSLVNKVDETIYIGETPFNHLDHLKRVTIGYYIDQFVYEVVNDEDNKLMYELYDYITLDKIKVYEVGEGLE